MIFWYKCVLWNNKANKDIEYRRHLLFVMEGLKMFQVYNALLLLITLWYTIDLPNLVFLSEILYLLISISATLLHLAALSIRALGNNHATLTVWIWYFQIWYYKWHQAVFVSVSLSVLFDWAWGSPGSIYVVPFFFSF